MSKIKNQKKTIETKILFTLKQSPKKRFNYKQLAAVLDIRDAKGRNHIIKSLQRLKHNNILKEPSTGQFQFNIGNGETVVGTVEITSSGGIVKNGTDEILIEKRYLNRALTGDTVSVVLSSAGNSNNGLKGKVTDILERSRKEYVGILERHSDFGFVLTKNSRMRTDFFIEKEELKDFKDGDKVVVVLKDWPRRSESPFGKIIRSLGTPGKAETEIHAILHDYGLPYEFPKEVESLANQIDRKIYKDEVKKRRDFRNVLTFTIDPISAKDFDDAISFQKIDDNLFEIGIHIADVSHYVRPGTVLEEEAYNRATSVYLTDRVVPMLPEVLSNGVCSLRPNEEKYTFSAIFHIDKNARVKKEWFGRTVIRSDYRFSYEEIQFVIENQSCTIPENVSLMGKSCTVSKSTFEAVNVLNGLAKQMRAERIRKGAISFDRVEVNFHLDEDNNPLSVYFKSSEEAHKLIEEFMLLANKKVAEFVGKKQLLFVYRVHDQPDIEKLLDLKRIVSLFGYKLNLKSERLSLSINNLLSDCYGKSEQNLIDTLTLRCMSKAEYTTKNIGHYGLAFEYYTHFTSPIRRYPDILVHRLLQSHLDGKNNGVDTNLEEACIYSSQREQLAVKAERDSVKYMQVVFMEDKVGQIFDGVISGVTERGLYVEIIENKCEGMIRVSDIKGDYYRHDVHNHSLVGERRKRVFQLGDSIRILVKKVNVVKRYLDFEIA